MIDIRAAHTRRWRGCVRWVICWLLLIPCGAGCSRPFWRTQADFDTYNLLLEKTADPRWDVPRLTLEPDLRSRIHDPFDPDLSPLPPDDDAAHQYMYWVDGMRSYKSWHKFGQQMSVENPHWLAQFGLAPEDFEVEWINPDDLAGEGQTRRQVFTIENMTLEQAIELASINSRDFQTQLENTYLSALALTFARFQFNVRYLGFNGLQPTSLLNYVTQPSTLDTLQYSKRFGISQLLPTGGQWIAEVANNTLWLFSTPAERTSASVLSYSLVQPLLAGGGRKVVLENLTLGERELLYDIRTLARFRRLFFASAVINDPASGGFLGLMQQIQQVENLRSNLREFRIQIEKLRAINSDPDKKVQESLAAWPEGLEIPADLANRLTYDAEQQLLQWQGEFTLSDEEQLIGLSNDLAFQRAIRSIAGRYRLDVITQDLAQILPQAANVQNNLRSAEASLLDNIDDYKLFLGLPTDFQITLDRSLLKPFELIDPRLTAMEDRLQQTIRTWDNPDGSPLTQPQTVEIAKLLLSLGRRLEREGLELVSGDLERERANRPARLKQLSSPADREQVLRNVERDEILMQRNQDEFKLLMGVLSQMKLLLEGKDLPLTEPETPELLAPEDYSNIIAYARQEETPTLDECLGLLRAVREDFLQIVQGLKVVQVGSRSELITLRDFEMTLEDATALAMENRLDLMNARAQVMDARRNLEVVANRMEGVLNVVTRGDIRNSGGANPFDFRADESTFQFGVQFTAPLDQVLVRNNYRAALIAYQQARRAYMQLEDTIKANVRAEWRALQLNKANFETGRQNIRYAAIQYDVTVETAYQPSSSAASAIPAVGGGSRQAPNTGLNLLNALNGILNAQNNLINFWVAYERNRINIFRDLDMMEIDDRGLWRDPAYQPDAAIVPTDPSEPADEVLPPPLAGAGRNVSPDVFARPRAETNLAAWPAEAGEADRGRDRVDDAGVLYLSRTADRAADARRGIFPSLRR